MFAPNFDNRKSLVALNQGLNEQKKLRLELEFVKMSVAENLRFYSYSLNLHKTFKTFFSLVL